MRILIASDAWHPQINGVVRTLSRLGVELGRLGHQVGYLTPDRFRTVPCPTYPEIRLALATRRGIARLIGDFAPDAIHIATEGPMGWSVRAYCLRRKLPFTTAFHTRFPEYLRLRFAIPESWTYRLLRHFHDAGRGLLVATPTIEAELRRFGFTRLRRWSRGVDTGIFHPRSAEEIAAAAPELTGLPRPFFLFVGRVAVEKNLPAFLDLDLPGTKLVVGAGPALDKMRRRYPQVFFAGVREGEALAAYYAAADLFVFPSRSDTFGLVLIEALASGTPVAAYPVPGPLDVVAGSGVAVLDERLDRAIEAALALNLGREACRAYARGFDWEASARQFLSHLAPFGPGAINHDRMPVADGVAAV